MLHDRVPRHFGLEIKEAICIRQAVLAAGFNDSISIGSNNAFSIRTSLRLTIQSRTATMEEWRAVVAACPISWDHITAYDPHPEFADWWPSL